jgi:adenylate cyclase
MRQPPSGPSLRPSTTLGSRSPSVLNLPARAKSDNIKSAKASMQVGFPMKRRMTAIMVGDIVGYSAMMEKSEEKAIARLTTCPTLTSEKVASLDGRIFNTAGDSTLAEFPSAINALRRAVEIGVALAGIDGSDVEPLKMRFGVHVADVAVHGGDLVGDGVNLAARIQQAAPPGAVWVSGVLFDHIRRNSPFAFDDLGERRFKNFSEPIRVYQVRGEMGAHRLQSAPTRSSSDRGKRPSSLAIMPFRVSGGDEDQRFLAEGLTEELIVELGRFKRLHIASRSASFALDSNSDPVSIGEALRVRYVLDGQVQKDWEEHPSWPHAFRDRGRLGDLERQDRPSFRGPMGYARCNGVEDCRDCRRADGGREYGGGKAKAA